MALEKLQNELSLLDGLLVLEEELDRAESEGVIASQAESSARFFTQKADQSYIPVLRDRLFRLGYLKVRSESDDVDDALKNAVSRMQQEAGLTVDGWVGSETWTALQELFAFEPSTHLERWIDAKGMTPALHRAVFLRLISLGFIPDKTRASLAPLDEPMAEWRRTLVLLKAPGISDDAPTDDLDLIRYLFDIDALSRLVHESGSGIAELLDNNRLKDGALLRRFLNCLLNIELWLLGYDGVKPNGRPGEIRRERKFIRRGGPKGRRGKWVDVDSGFYKIIRSFWSDLDMSRELSKEGEILLYSFEVLHTMDEPELDERTERVRRAKEIIEQVETDEAGVMEEWNTRSFMGRAWDGAKRVWRFLKRLIRKTVRRIKLLVRAAYQLATEGLSLVRRTIQIFSAGMGLLFSDVVPGSNEEISMRHTVDFDFQVFVHSQIDSSVMHRFLEGLQRSLVALRACVRIMKLLVSLAVSAAKAATGPWGWWSVLRSLISLCGGLDDEDRRIIMEAYAV